MDKAFAERFAADRVAAWNAHDLDAVLSHYTDDFETVRPFLLPKDAGGRWSFTKY